MPLVNSFILTKIGVISISPASKKLLMIITLSVFALVSGILLLHVATHFLLMLTQTWGLSYDLALAIAAAVADGDTFLIGIIAPELIPILATLTFIFSFGGASIVVAY